MYWKSPLGPREDKTLLTEAIEGECRVKGAAIPLAKAFEIRSFKTTNVIRLRANVELVAPIPSSNSRLARSREDSQSLLSEPASEENIQAFV